MRDPQQVSDQLESLMVDVEHTEQTVRHSAGAQVL
jgi:hypothetical protein